MFPKEKCSIRLDHLDPQVQKLGLLLNLPQKITENPKFINTFQQKFDTHRIYGAGIYIYIC